jgi:PAS domain-containing protein
VLDGFAQVITECEDWLVQRLLHYATEWGYTRYTSTLVEAWRASVAGLSKALLDSLGSGLTEPTPDERYSLHPAAAFGVHEARLHRGRGITLTMFLGLIKYYRRTYCDLLREQGYPRERERRCLHYINLFFDRVELGFCEEWTSQTGRQMVAELQEHNRALTNEKNKYLTVFESLSDPVVLLDADCRVDNLNHEALQLLGQTGQPGSAYYGERPAEGILAWLTADAQRFAASSSDEERIERSIVTTQGVRHFHLKLKRMTDVSRKFSGTTVILEDVTARRLADRMREAVYQMSEAAHVSTDQAELLSLIGPTLASLVRADVFDLCLDREEGCECWKIVPDLGQEVEPVRVERGTPGPGELSDAASALAVEEAHRSRKPMHVGASTLAQWYGQGLLEALPAWRECIAAPLSSWEGQRRAVGILIAWLVGDGPGYTQSDLETLAFLATQVGTAIERQRAEAEQERLIAELREALSRVKTLSGLLPICAHCKKVRDDSGYWSALEDYLRTHSDAEFSHGICPECMELLYPEFLPAEASDEDGGHRRE